jgi:hypothetical protein
MYTTVMFPAGRFGRLHNIKLVYWILGWLICLIVRLLGPSFILLDSQHHHRDSNGIDVFFFREHGVAMSQNLGSFRTLERVPPAATFHYML